MGASPRFPEVGEVFANRYTIQASLSESRTSRLYAVTDAQTRGRAALKVLVPQAASNSTELIQRFNREAQALSLVASRHCIQLNDYGQSSGGQLYMALEWVDGPSLADEIARGPLGVARSLTIMRQLLEVLQVLHNAGIIHRDIKPSHVLLTERDGRTDRVKLLDFAIAKSWTHTAKGEPLLGDFTAKGRMMGTPRYMSPEQVVGRRVVPQSDLYSLGLVVIEMLTGRQANPGEDVVEVVQRHLSEDPFQIPPDLPPPLALALRRMVAKPLEERPQSASEVLGIIGPLAAATQATRGDETMPVGAIAQQAAETNPNAPVLPVHADEPTLPPDQVGQIVGAAVADDETVKFDRALHGAVARVTDDEEPSQLMFDPSDTGRISVQREDDEAFQIHLPRPTGVRAMVQISVTAIVTFVVTIMLTPWVVPVGLLIMLVLFFASRVERTLRIDPDKWELTARMWKWSRTDSGSLAELQGLGQDSGTILMTTDSGTDTVASGYSQEEALAVCQRANDWLTRNK